MPNQFLQNTRNELKAIKKELVSTEKEVNRLLNLILDGLDSEAARQRLKDTEAKKLFLEVKVTEMEIAGEKAAPANKGNIRKFLSQLQGLSGRTRQEQKIIIGQFVKRITVAPDDNKGWIVTIETNLDRLKKNKSPLKINEDLRIVMER